MRVIGGRLRGSKLAYEPLRPLGTPGGAPVTRPMKHRVREAIFNLVGIEAKGKHALDLFAGTGALGIEAVSRGALSALFIERHVPTAAVVERNLTTLGVADQCELLKTSAFLWAARDLPAYEGPLEDSPPGEVGAGEAGAAERRRRPWLAFVSPPYDFFVERADEMLSLIFALEEHAPAGSMLVVEADKRFDFTQLGHVRETRHDTGWDVRPYSPAVVGVWRVDDQHDERRSQD
ncbi:Ribosomal RNA small subunit methyltransferase D [Pseudobythopirellula maris]|uniref:Ribosomal RNA small subunit methyltransferase D n=2 Tax=Pseudobythopirellula maris TaxID=2527991 RepID=A0A5C5ZMR8_9BACT|nr:Ribosomal RNA small subunit methyltransferase D [Pseudobythopirellula maris]